MFICYGCKEEQEEIIEPPKEIEVEEKETEEEMPIEVELEEPKISRCDRILEAWKMIEGYPYVWGGESFAEGGFDCSGAIYKVQKTIGEPVPRTTSRKYNLLAGGNTKHWKDGQCGDWIWWTFTPDRPYGHIGQHTEENIWQSGSSTGPTEISIWPGSYWDGIFEETKSLK